MCLFIHSTLTDIWIISSSELLWTLSLGRFSLSIFWHTEMLFCCFQFFFFKSIYFSPSYSWKLPLLHASTSTWNHQSFQFQPLWKVCTVVFHHDFNFSLWWLWTAFQLFIDRVDIHLWHAHLGYFFIFLSRKSFSYKFLNFFKSIFKNIFWL